MLLRTLNNPDRLMAPIDEETFCHLRETFGDDVLARDLTYLTSIGLVQADAAIIGADGMVHFNRGCMGLTAAGVDYANVGTVGSELHAIEIKVHKQTLDQLENLINAANLGDREKHSLLQMVKEKGAETVVGKCVDIVFANAGIATQVLHHLADYVK